MKLILTKQQKHVKCHKPWLIDVNLLNFDNLSLNYPQAHVVEFLNNAQSNFVCVDHAYSLLLAFSHVSFYGITQ